MNKIYTAIFAFTLLISFSGYGQVFPYREAFDSYTAPQPVNGVGGIRATGSVEIMARGIVGNCVEFQMASANALHDTLISPVIGPLTGNTVASFYFRVVTYSGGVPVRYAMTANDKAEIYVGDTGFVFPIPPQYTINSSTQNSGTAYIKGAVGGPTAINGLAGRFKIITSNPSGNNWLLEMDSFVVRDTITIRPTLTSVVINDSCRGDSTGSIHVTATGATPPYHYIWNTGDTTPSIDHLAGGIYHLTVTDDLNAATVRADTVLQPALQLLLDSLHSRDALCHGAAEGSAEIYARGGTPAYSYIWSSTPIQTTPQAQNLPAGNYSVTVTDSKGCTVSATTQISEPSALTVTLSSVGSTGISGSATATVAGGTPPYTYLWSGGQNIATISGLAPGRYGVQVSDSNGCVKADTVTVDNISGISEVGDNGLKIYPNPASGALNISLKGTNGSAASAIVYDMTGRTVLTEEAVRDSINVSPLREGVYMIRVTSAGKSYVRRFTIQR